jgi:hypothetical protein
MFPFLYAAICSVAIAIGAAWLLNTQQRTAAEAFATSATRVGDPGHNLTGPYDNLVGPGTGTNTPKSGGI